MKQLTAERRTRISTELHRFISSASKLKSIKRSGWYKKADIQDCESVADHSFRCALLAVYFALDMGLDAGKAARMALMHDLAEAETGDLMPEEQSSVLAHRESEKRLLISLIENLPSKNAAKTLLSDANELFEAKTDESKLVWQVDKLEMGLQQREYIAKGYDKTKLAQFAENLGVKSNFEDILDSYTP